MLTPALGCGSEPRSTTGELVTLEPAGSVGVAIAKPVRTIDPLEVRSRGERLVARQIFEPLISNERGPFGSTRVRDGIVRSIRSVNGGSAWIARLRPGVRFTRGALVDAEAVKANVERWQASETGSRLLPGLVTTFAPRPNRIQFQLAAPDKGFPERLSDGRLGLVAPDAIKRAAGGEIRFSAAGAGPFELRGADPDQLLLVRNPEWWGSSLGLGPGVDTLEFETVAEPSARADRVITGDVGIADQLNLASAARLEDEPLTSILGGDVGGDLQIGVERSVRGIDGTAADQQLADVWLTTLR